MKRVLYICFILLQFNVSGQIHVTLSDAIDTALKSNFDIRIARVNTSINTNNNTFGMAGGLPSFNASASDNNSLYNLKQKTSSGLNITKDNVSSSSVNANLTASMILFNGFKIMATKTQLNLLQRQSELQLNQQIQNTIAAVMIAYYDILRQESYLNIIESLLAVSSKKLDIVRERSAVGMANEADLLQAQIDVNSDEQNLKNQQLIIEQGKTNLLQLMGVKSYFPITVHDTIMIDEGLNRDSIIGYLENNQQYLSAEQQVMINEQIVREIKAQRYPTVRINAGYNFTYNSSTAGFNLFTQNYGPTAGATLQMPIFNGTIYKKQQEAASFNVENARLQKESLLLSLKANVINTYYSYDNSKLQLKSQKTSYQNAGKLVNMIIQRFRLNQATILDVKAAQSSFETAGYIYVNLQYAAKVAEIELKRLNYRLGF